MTAPETPRERAIRLWEAAGYAEAAALAASTALDDGTYDAYEAGKARYRKEHP